MIQIIAYDPGLTTGLCILEDTLEKGFHYYQGQLTFRQVGDLLGRWGANIKDALAPECVFVCESFTINQQTARNSQAPWSLEVIGLIRYFALVHNIELIFQQPSAAKSLITDEVIHKAGLWKPGNPHAMDATRHALMYATTKKGALRECLTPE